MAIYFPNVPATFIHIPKCAGTMLRVWAEFNVENYTELPIHRHAQLDKLRQTGIDLGTVFTIVRNPYERIVSQFFYYGQAAEKRVNEKFKYETERKRLNDILEIRSYQRGFENYINKLYNKQYNEIWFDPHYSTEWKRSDTQCNWLSGEEVLVIKMEDIKTEFKTIQNLIGCNVPFPDALNASKHEHYRNYYTDELKNKVYEIFEEDFVKFNYDF
jgi:hypothetical protein